MVVAYRLAPLTFWILKRMVKSPYISLPNLLAQRLLVPELLQDDATPEALAKTLLPLIDGGEEQTAVLTTFTAPCAGMRRIRRRTPY